MQFLFSLQPVACVGPFAHLLPGHAVLTPVFKEPTPTSSPFWGPTYTEELPRIKLTRSLTSIQRILPRLVAFPILLKLFPDGVLPRALHSILETAAL